MTLPSPRAVLTGLAATLGLAASPVDGPSLTPVPRDEEGILPRQQLVLERARTAPPAAVVFVGDSITQGWEDGGRASWERTIAPLGAVNLGVSGDRTEHVLWRLSQAPLTRLAPRVVVLLIGTNNLGHQHDDAKGTLAGVTAVARMIRAQVPEATLALMAVFPRGEGLNAMRGDLLQINQALQSAFKDDPKVRWIDCGARFVKADGSIDAALMPDALHLSPAGYAIWAEALAPVMPAPSRP
ncbi:MAG: hypothetical protein FJ252_01820 [Phycisphaerae bacterium]|nr:hypothetical protein [Phycisphaerae bacterium]